MCSYPPGVLEYRTSTWVLYLEATTYFMPAAIRCTAACALVFEYKVESIDVKSMIHFLEKVRNIGKSR